MLCIVFLIPVVLGGTELLNNGDFENRHFSKSNWWGIAATLTPTDDAYEGHTAVKVTKRIHDYGELVQTVSVKGGHRYYFRAHIKLLNYGSHGAWYHKISPGIMVKDRHSGKQQLLAFGFTPHIQTHQWHIIGGDLLLPDIDISEARVYIRADDQSVDYIVDSASLQEVPSLSGFPADANKKIEQIRKADLTIRLDDHSVAPSGLTLELVQTKSQFPFGSTVNAREFVNPHSKPYQDFFFKHFTWASIENHLKWTLMEPTRGHVDYTTAMKAIDALTAKGIKVRGHNLFWESHSPGWVNNLHGSALKNAMETRLKEVLGHYKGKLEHWDVDNEALHSDKLVKNSGDKNLTMWMFREAHKIDPHPTLFLNEYGAVKDHTATVALEDMAIYYKNAGIPVGAVGIMSHLKAPIDLAAVKARVDEVAKAGFPIWITEMTVEGVKEQDKPQMFEDLLRIYFSHPHVYGILLWGYWDKIISRPTSDLCNGPSCTLNDSGKRVSHLLLSEWMTHETHSIHKGQTLHVRGFKGNYNLRVKHNNHVIHEEEFYLPHHGTSLKLSLAGSSSKPHVSNILVG